MKYFGSKLYLKYFGPRCEVLHTSSVSIACVGLFNKLDQKNSRSDIKLESTGLLVNKLAKLLKVRKPGKLWAEIVWAQ